jgi:hypothetical protein
MVRLLLVLLLMLLVLLLMVLMVLLVVIRQSTTALLATCLRRRVVAISLPLLVTVTVVVPTTPTPPVSLHRPLVRMIVVGDRIRDDCARDSSKVVVETSLHSSSSSSSLEGWIVGGDQNHARDGARSSPEGHGANAGGDSGGIGRRVLGAPGRGTNRGAARVTHHASFFDRLLLPGFTQGHADRRHGTANEDWQQRVRGSAR